MRSILVLHLADTVTHGGLGMSAGTAASASAAYGTLVYLVSVAGGWLADRILGSYRAVLWGGALIACGHYAMAVPTAGMTWVHMGHGQPHASDKIAEGVALGGLSFLLMVLPTAGHSSDDYLMSVWWLVGSYLLLGLGDALLETSGMSATTKLAPAAFAGQTMSLWFLSLALANGIQAQTVKLYDDVSQPACFGVNGAIAVVAVLAAPRWLRRTMHPVH